MKHLISIFSIAIAALLVTFSPSHAQDMNSNKATLIVYRDGFIYGALKNFDVKVDGQKMGELAKNKSMHSYKLDAGNHKVAPGDEDKALAISAQAGKTYIVEYKVRFGLLGALPKLELKTMKEAKDDSKKVSHYYKKKMMM